MLIVNLFHLSSHLPQAMPALRRLDSLPFDVFYQIATSLDDRDFINLSRTNRTMHELTKSDLIARKIVEVRPSNPLRASKPQTFRASELQSLMEPLLPRPEAKSQPLVTCSSNY